MDKIELKPCPFCGKPKGELEQEGGIMAETSRERLKRLGITYEKAFGLYLIKGEPAADVRRERHGHWIEEEDIQICSECGEEHSWQDYRASYCDTCGARMDGKDGEQE